MSDLDDEFVLTIKHGKETHSITLSVNVTFAALKQQIQDDIGVPLARQKLLGVPKFKDDDLVHAAKFKKALTLLLIGSTEETLLKPPDVEYNIIDDLDTTTGKPIIATLKTSVVTFHS